MLQIQVLRQHPEAVKDKLKVKNFKHVNSVDDVLNIDVKRRQLQVQHEQLLAEVNQLSKQIGQLMAQGQKDTAEGLKKNVNEHKETLKKIAFDLDELEKQQHDVLLKLPNLPHHSVPLGTQPDDNVEVKKGGQQTLPSSAQTLLPHWDLAKKFDLIDFELGNKVTGSGFPFYKKQGAKLVRTLIQFFLDCNTNAGYDEYLAPILVNEDSAYGTGQLPDKEGQMYYQPQDNLYLIPTAEVPLTNIFRDTIIPKKDLPIKITGYTPCFRREAGSYGKDVRGLNRLHQFDKVEIVQIVEDDTSYHVLDSMVQHVERILIDLELPYRILKLCGGDMSFASALTYDFEVYSAAQQKWLEVSSVSNFESFQTNRMKIRTKDDSGKTKLLHSLNGSSLALPRIIAALLENHQQDDHIALPKALHSYFGATQITLPH